MSTVEGHARRSRLVSEADAVAAVADGMTIGIGGFINSGHPMSIVRELIRSGRRDLTVVGAASAGLEIDLLIAAGVAAKVVTPYVGAEGLAGVGPAFRRAAQTDSIEVFELDEAHYYAGLRASAQRVPFNPWVAGVGTSLPEVNPALKVFQDPIKGTPVIAVPAIEIDVCFLHVACSDAYGNVQHNGTAYGDVAISAASERTFVSTERIIPSEQIRAAPWLTTIDGVTGVVRAPFGAHPFSAEGYYRPDEQHIRRYIAAAESWLRKDSRDGIDEYLDHYVLGPADHMDYLDRIGARRLFDLYEY
ncbi:CoA transferase subunit A [Amycolatopsis sp. K13G38]|uniref:CoA transferase subunit A n=1 Tax=Amycolatopsis acididurans TaxID=2724524 RepID=A0ABX1J8I8_9PSEU|nr:CoA transferase subunit A [Amycolatopsis acididurans]NKQ56115.1 CoA transferase subunit A [Amycolatopsis acididurans]